MVRTLSIIVFSLLVLLPLATLLPGLFTAPEIHWASLQWSSWLTSAGLSLSVTLVTTLVVCYLGLTWARTLVHAKLVHQLAPILAMPHVAFTIGLLMLVSPSGWLVRIIEAVLGIFPQPPLSWPFPDKSVVTLTLTLMLKEVCFLLLMLVSQGRQLPLMRWQNQAKSMGYSERRAWWLVVVPSLLPRVWLPLLAIAIYTISVVDIPLLVGPNTPALLAPRVHESSLQFSAQAAGEAWLGQWLLLALSGLLVVLTRLHQLGYTYWARRRLGAIASISKSRSRSGYGYQILSVIAALTILALMLNSFTLYWFYPALWPQQFGLDYWHNEWAYVLPLLGNSFYLAITSSFIGLLAAIAVLERARQLGEKKLAWWPLLLLLVPQLPLVLGWQQQLGQDVSDAWLVWSHTVFTFPYCYLVLHGAYVNFPKRWLNQAQSLGHSPWSAWFRIMLPNLKHVISVSFAVGISVSIAQYLPTLWLAGSSRPTLTTEAVSIAAGGDWRLASVYALMQTLLPLLALVCCNRQSSAY